MTRCFGVPLAAVMLIVVQVASVGVASPQTEESSFRVAIPRVSSAPNLGMMGPGDLPQAVAVSDFRQNQPADGSPASLSTTAYLSYDNNNLYVVFDCHDDAEQVRARLAKREDISDDDQVLVYLDTFRDRRRAYVFGVNPLGVQRDGILTEGQGTDYSFDAVWRSEAKVTDRGYMVLIAIPFRSLRFSNDPTQAWGIALGRYIARESEYSYWPFITKRLDGFVNQMADLNGIERVSPGHNVQLVPYGAFTGSRYLDSSVPAFIRSTDGRGGLDSKIVIRDALTVDVTLNPDFSQVESDDPQVTVNKRFEVLFPEKRPFYIENAGFFVTPENLFFSRRIVDPQFGGRLTGKVNGWAIGALVTDDRGDGESHSFSSPFASRRAEAAVARVQREVGKESLLGILATSRDFASSFNRVVAADTRLKLSPTWVFAGQVIRSDDQSLDGNKQQGSAANASITRNGRGFSYKASFLERSPEFNAPLGFIERVDIREIHQNANHYWHPNSGPLMSFGPALSTSMDWNYRGQRQDWSAQPELDFFFRHQYGISLYHHESYELFRSVAFREYSNTVSAYSAQSKRLSLSGSLEVGTSPNYSPPQGVTPFLGNVINASLGLTYRPAQRLRIEERYYFSRLNARSELGSVASTDGAASNVFRNDISRTKMNVQFTRNLSVRAIVEYNTLVPNQSLIQQTLNKHLTGDVLFTYLVNPFTAIYVGYNEMYQNLALDSPALDAVPPQTSRLRVLDSPSTLTSHQVFVKISYRFGL
jgi:uncharacterized protein DUF5916/cellulose/xylan binding protein with CBM9 domain